MTTKYNLWFMRKFESNKIFSFIFCVQFWRLKKVWTKFQRVIEISTHITAILFLDNFPTKFSFGRIFISSVVNQKSFLHQNKDWKATNVRACAGNSSHLALTFMSYQYFLSLVEDFSDSFAANGSLSLDLKKQ